MSRCREGALLQVRYQTEMGNLSRLARRGTQISKIANAKEEAESFKILLKDHDSTCDKCNDNVN